MEKIVVGLSGGVDSSVAAYTLKKQGYEVITVTLLVDKNITGELDGAREVARKLNVKHKVLDVSSEFNKIVIKSFIEGYDNGITPSPCIICDERVKIKSLIEYADIVGAKYISTGHYCGLEYSKTLGCYTLKNARDNKKDQTYMLYRLGETVLKRMKFPLYNFKKIEVREIARKIKIGTHDKKDSQGICFAQEGYKKYLKKELKGKIKKGNFIDENGDILGVHEGYQLYTVGQRRGLNLKKPKPYFILDINPQSNEIMVGDYDRLYKKYIRLTDCKFIPEIDKLKNIELIGKPRFSSCGHIGKLRIKKIRTKEKDTEEKEEVFFEYKDKNPQNARGQHMVIYYKNYLVGGGIIV